MMQEYSGKELHLMCICPSCKTDVGSALDIKKVCPICGYERYDNPVPAVAGIIQVEDNILVVSPHRRDDSWVLPGGYVMYGENLEDALVREIKEETNLAIEIERYLASYPLTKKGREILFVVFVARAKTRDIQAGDDVGEVLEMSLRDALEKLTGRLAKKAVGLWMAEQSGPS
jgi:NADH pyrophosphatase NudC (nudix superfamily)